MAESRRNKQREIFRQQLAQTWDDARIHPVPEQSSEPWESDRVVEVNPSAAPPLQPPPVSPEVPRGGKDEPDFSLTPPKLRHPVFEMVRTAVRRDGFTHPEAGNFII